MTNKGGFFFESQAVDHTLHSLELIFQIPRLDVCLSVYRSQRPPLKTGDSWGWDLIN